MNNFLEIRNNDVVKLSPKFLDVDLKQHILRSLQKKYEGMCSKYGYIKMNSINVIDVKYGVVEMSTFHGYVNFDVEFTSLICNPPINSIVKCTVKNINSFGVLCISGIHEKGVFSHILNIIVPKNHHNQEISNNVEFAKLSVNDEINVEILGKKYILNNKTINIFGRIVDKSTDHVNVDDTTTGRSSKDNDNASSDDEADNIEELSVTNLNDDDSSYMDDEPDNEKDSSVDDEDEKSIVEEDIENEEDALSEINGPSDSDEV